MPSPGKCSLRESVQNLNSQPNNDPVALVLSRLEGVRKAGDGWAALCPIHDDTEASLSVGWGRDNDRAVVFCHAACDTASVLSTIGLEYRDLFVTDAARAPQPRPAPRPVPEKPRKRPKKPADPGPWTETRRHIYRDEAGECLYWKAKLTSPAGGSQWRREKGKTSSLYGLENLELARDSVLFVSESEKDADRLMELGDVIAVSSGGASTWKEEWTAAIDRAAPRRVVILPHNDDAGRTFAETARASISPYRLVSVLELADVTSPAGFDAADWLENGGDLDQLHHLIDQMSQLSPDRENTLRDNCDIDHHYCVSPRWIGMHARELGRAKSIPGRCGQCRECKLWHREKRRSRLMDGLRNWTRVEMLTCADQAAYRALTKRLERMREKTGDDLAHVSIPYPDEARLVLTEAELGGEALDTAPTALLERLEALLIGARDEKGARLDGSKNWQKREAGRKHERSKSQWEKIGESKKKNPSEQAAIFERFKCVPVRSSGVASRKPRPTEYDISHLSELELEQLWWSLGWLKEENRRTA